MSSYFTVLDTNEGKVHILTKTRWMALVPMPHTSVSPHHTADLGRLGTFIKWTTNDSQVLADLHQAIIRLVTQIGISGLVEVADSAKRTEEAWKALGGNGSGMREMVKQATQENVPFPVPDDVLRYVKSFM